MRDPGSRFFLLSIVAPLAGCPVTINSDDGVLDGADGGTGDGDGDGDGSGDDGSGDDGSGDDGSGDGMDGPLDTGGDGMTSDDGPVDTGYVDTGYVDTGYASGGYCAEIPPVMGEISSLCSSYEAKLMECSNGMFPDQCTGYFEALCQYVIEYYTTTISQDCGTAAEELFACLNALDCAELGGDGDLCPDEQMALSTTCGF